MKISHTHIINGALEILDIVISVLKSNFLLFLLISYFTIEK